MVLEPSTALTVNACGLESAWGTPPLKNGFSDSVTASVGCRPCGSLPETVTLTVVSLVAGHGTVALMPVGPAVSSTMPPEVSEATLPAASRTQPMTVLVPSPSLSSTPEEPVQDTQGRT